MPKLEPQFWRSKPLSAMSRAEWEALCDGCGKCCLLKLEYEETGEIAFTDVACRLLDPTTARCTDYTNRKRRVPDCVRISPRNIATLGFMPTSCAYRRLAEGRDLASWHPLVSGDPDSVHLAGMSVRDRVISETELADEADLLDRVVTWPKRGAAT